MLAIDIRRRITSGIAGVSSARYDGGFRPLLWSRSSRGRDAPVGGRRAVECLNTRSPHGQSGKTVRPSVNTMGEKVREKG